jgi:hypothetical protein
MVRRGAGAPRGPRENFAPEVKAAAEDRQGGRCALCGKAFRARSRKQYHHVNADRTHARGGNCAVLHRACHGKAHLGRFDGDDVLHWSAFLFWDAGRPGFVEPRTIFW